MKKILKFGFISLIVLIIFFHKISTKFVKSYRNQTQNIAYITGKPQYSIKDPFPEDS